MSIIIVAAATTARATPTRLATTRLATTRTTTAATRPPTTTARPPSTKSTAATRSTATKSAAGATAPESTTSARCLGARFVDVQGPPPQFLTIEGCNGFVGFTGIRHLHKSESTGAAGIPVRNHTHLVDLSMGLEECSQFRFGGAVWDIAYEKLLHAISSFL
jgi:hypothetical protein